jgi:hypothetical protein
VAPVLTEGFLILTISAPVLAVLGIGALIADLIETFLNR